jgi:putative serine protease PepD
MSPRRVELLDWTKLPAQLTGLDPLDDLAVVKIAPRQHMAVAKLGDSSQLQVGQTVLAIGSPLGVTQTVTSGIVSALGRNVPAGERGGVIFNSIQMDAAINPGNSGGALVDLQGDLIGIPTLTIVNP